MAKNHNGQNCPKAIYPRIGCPTTYPAGTAAADRTGCVTPGTAKTDRRKS